MIAPLKPFGAFAIPEIYRNPPRLLCDDPMQAKT